MGPPSDPVRQFILGRSDITITTDHGACDATVAFATSARGLQRASNLLALLADEQIWQRMLAAGLPDDWREELAARLAAARADYRYRWSLHQRTGPAGGASSESSPDAHGAAGSSDAELAAVVGRISVAGGRLFSETGSLASRFAAAASDPPTLR